MRAVKAIQEGSAWFAADRAAADKILAATAGELDLSRGGNPLAGAATSSPRRMSWKNAARPVGGIDAGIAAAQAAAWVRIGIHAGYGDEITRDFFGRLPRCCGNHRVAQPGRAGSI